MFIGSQLCQVSNGKEDLPAATDLKVSVLLMEFGSKVNEKPSDLRSSRCNLCVLCVSVVVVWCIPITTETQRHRGVTERVNQHTTTKRVTFRVKRYLAHCLLDCDLALLD